MDNSANESSDDEKKIMNSSWKRMQNMHLTDGFREGAIAGKDKQYQLSFDDGYTTAFQKAFDVGYNSGVERIQLFLLKKDRKSSSMQKLQTSLDHLCTTCNGK
ncbi:uncharacterized protein LOC135836698 [Planococcus citri]|uniref:uncharacterized protein LOC135836698 n=1 Tax=Planococcus citri TaxID=170843 RepID=UPI0031F9FD94